MTQGLTRGLSIRHCQLVQCHECRDETSDYGSEKWSAKSLGILSIIPLWWTVIAYVLLKTTERLLLSFNIRISNFIEANIWRFVSLQGSKKFRELKVSSRILRFNNLKYTEKKSTKNKKIILKIYIIFYGKSFYRELLWLCPDSSYNWTVLFFAMNSV